MGFYIGYNLESPTRPQFPIILTIRTPSISALSFWKRQYAIQVLFGSPVVLTAAPIPRGGSVAYFFAFFGFWARNTLPLSPTKGLLHRSEGSKYLYSRYPEAPKALEIIIPRKKIGHSQKGTTLEPLGMDISIYIPAPPNSPK